MGVLERREREKEKRRLEIINAAEKVFYKKGFDNSTMDDVAAEAELSKGAIYFYFKSKAEICLSILLRLLKEIHENFQLIMNKEISGYEKFRQLCTSYLDFYDKHPNFLIAVSNFRHHKEHCDDESQVLQAVLDTNELITATLKQSLEIGLNDNSISTKVVPELLSTALWGDLNGLLLYLSISDAELLNNGSTPSVRLFLYMLNLLSDSIKK